MAGLTISIVLGLLMVLLSMKELDASGYVTYQLYPPSSSSCSGSPMYAEVLAVDTCYVFGTTSQEYTYSSGIITQTTYTDTTCTTVANTYPVTASTCGDDDSHGGNIEFTYSSSWPGFSSSGLFQKQYFSTGCTGSVIGVWMENNQCIPMTDDGTSQKVLVSGDQATLYLYSSGTGCSGTSSSFPNEVVSSCTAITSGGVTGAQSMTSYLTGQSSSSDSGDVGSLTGQQVIWVMIAVLFGAAVCGAGLFTMLCPHCIKDGFGGDNSRPDTTK